MQTLFIFLILSASFSAILYLHLLKTVFHVKRGKILFVTFFLGQAILQYSFMVGRLPVDAFQFPFNLFANLIESTPIVGLLLSILLIIKRVTLKLHSVSQ